jgi:hypothetical protein
VGGENKKLSNDEIKKLPPSKSDLLEKEDVLKVCQEEEAVSKWHDCWGKIVIDRPCDPEKWCGTWSKGLYYNGKKHGFFHEGSWNGSSTQRSDGRFFSSNYYNGIKVGLVGECYYSQVGRTHFQIGNLNEKGEIEGVWGNFEAWYDSFPRNKNGGHETFFGSGCHAETALLYLNKEEPCSNKKTSKGRNNMFVGLIRYIKGVPHGYDQACRGASASEKSIDYKNTQEYQQWLELLESYSND